MKENSLYDKKSILSILGKNPDFKEIAKDCVAFSNAEGGIIDFGIEDDDELPKEGQKIPDDLDVILENRIKGLTQNVYIKAERMIAQNGGQFLRLIIKRSSNLISATITGKIYQRFGDKSMPVSPEDISRLFSERGNICWENMLSTINYIDADSLKLKQLIQNIHRSDRTSSFIREKEIKEILDYFYLTDPESGLLTNLGVLFIGKQTQRGRIQNTPIIQCIKYDDLGEKVNKWVWDDYSMNPQELIDDIWKRIPEWQESHEINDGMYRRNIMAYSERVIRELIANALVHKSYHIKGDIFINIHPHFIEVVSPGPLPFGVTPQNILHKTIKRNDHMANLFYVLHLMEREGSGYDTLYEELLSTGKPAPKVYEGEDYVKVIVERRIANLESIKLIEHVSQRFVLKQKQKICLGIIAQNESISANGLINFLGLDSSNDLNSWLFKLLEYGIIVSNNSKSKAKEYRVNPEYLKGSNYKGKTSLKRIENYRIKELIREDLKIYKEATLSEIHQRIGKEIPYKKIWNQIRLLIEEGVVCSIGENRWTKYKLI